MLYLIFHPDMPVDFSTVFICVPFPVINFAFAEESIAYSSNFNKEFVRTFVIPTHYDE